MKKYNLKVKFGEYWSTYTNCYFIQNIEEYQEYFQELNNKFAVSESEIKNLETFMGHGHSLLTGVSGMFCGMIEQKECRKPMLAHLKILQGSVLGDQLRHMLDGDKLLIQKTGGYFPIKPTQEVEIMELIDRKYTVDDIKVSKWFGGSHYYAKVGTIDVIDEYGDVKWNTEKRAHERAVQFIEMLNKPQQLNFNKTIFETDIKNK